MTLLLLAGLTGCFKPWDQLAILDFTDVPFANDSVSSTDARIRTYETGLSCPDGSNARFYAIYRAEETDPAPLAIGFHSGAFDYEISPEAPQDSALYGATWRAESRMSRDWADRMVWETLGMYPGDVIESEDNQGTLAAALIDAGVNQLWPANCWADLWHNEEGFQDNDYSREGFSRNGRTFAWWMVRLAEEEGFADSQGVALPFEPNNDLYLTGLGDGGRGVVELLTHTDMPAVAGVLVDSSPDTLSPYQDPTAELSADSEGLARLWAAQADFDSIDDWSLAALALANPAAPGALSAPPGGTADTGTTDTGTAGPGTADTGTADTGTADTGTADTGTADTGGAGTGTGHGGSDTGSTSPSIDAGGLGDLQAFSMPARTAMVWSAGDPRQPLATSTTTADTLDGRSDSWVMDTRRRAHVFSNANLPAATALVDYLLTGQQTDIDWQLSGSEADSTGTTTTTGGTTAATTTATATATATAPDECAP